MSGALQAVFQNQRSFIAPVPVIGSAYGGGFFAGQISTAGNSIADYNLVVGPIASTQNTLQWKTTNTDTPGTSSVVDGSTNTNNMNNASHPAAQFVRGLNVGGQTDWYMPAKNELEICYYNLKPSTTNNTIFYGINANAVPARASNYNSSGPPFQTSAADFKTTGAEDFATSAYWTSTQKTATVAWLQNFSNGNPSYAKDYPYRVRAIRKVAV